MNEIFCYFELMTDNMELRQKINKMKENAQNQIDEISKLKARLTNCQNIN